MNNNDIFNEINYLKKKTIILEEMLNIQDESKQTNVNQNLLDTTITSDKKSTTFKQNLNKRSIC